MLSGHDIFLHFEKLRDITRNIHVDSDNAYNAIIKRLSKGTVFFVGNGGSAAIASHMAIDYTKNGGYRAMAFNDAAALTCLSNDYSYEEVFSRQVEKWAAKGDILFVVSSSGKSTNVLRAAVAAKAKKCFVVTLSAFDQGNPLSKLGDMNFYVPAKEYGFAEISHLAILHSILDLAIKEKSCA